MSISLLTFNNSNISPADDGVLYKVIAKDGILSGCNITKSADNVFSISDGYILACGRVIKITSETHNATLTTSGTATYKLYIQINTSVPSAPIEIISGTKSSYTREDINGSGTIYELELVSYSASTTKIESFTKTISTIYAPADYIVEYGITNGKRWEKWVSGKAIIYGNADIYDITFTAFAGGGYSGTYTITLPFTLTSCESANVSVRTSQLAWISNITPSTTTVTYNIMQVNTTTRNAVITWFVVGTWK